MYLSISIDVAPGHSGSAGRDELLARAARIEAAAADFALIAGDGDSNLLLPSRVEAVVTMPWLAGHLRTPVVAVGIPALHSMPFHIARALSAADFLTGGRAGWLPLTSDRDCFDAAYGRAYAVDPAKVTPKYDDFVRATQTLWDSWDDDALVIDKASGIYVDSRKVRRVDYRGPYYATMGALNTARPPQGYPLLVRDLADIADSGVAADVVLGDRAALDALGRTGAIRLLKADAGTVRDGIDAVRTRAADGLHLVGPGAIDTLETLRERFRATLRPGATARERLGLARPVHPYAGKVAA